MPAIADDPQTRREAGYVPFGDPPQRVGFGPVTVEIDGTAKMAERRVGKYILTSNGAIKKMDRIAIASCSRSPGFALRVR